MRGTDEIDALMEAARFRFLFDDRGEMLSEDGEHHGTAVIVLTKGDPEILVCIEPAMTIHWPAPMQPERTATPILGPMTRLAIALHLNLTPEEAASVGMTAAQAQADLMGYLRDVVQPALEKHGVKVERLFEIPPHDPRWGRR